MGFRKGVFDHGRSFWAFLVKGVNLGGFDLGGKFWGGFDRGGSFWGFLTKGVAKGDL